MLIKDTDYFCTCKKKRKIEMMTVAEILDAKEINPEIMREALNQSEKRIAAQMQEKNDINNNLSSLFAMRRFTQLCQPNQSSIFSLPSK
jgi:hypothetical protein